MTEVNCSVIDDANSCLILFSMWYLKLARDDDCLIFKGK